MNVRLTYRVECVIAAKDPQEAAKIWNATSPCPPDRVGVSFKFVEMNSIEDGDSYEDLTDEFHQDC